MMNLSGMRAFGYITIIVFVTSVQCQLHQQNQSEPQQPEYSGRSYVGRNRAVSRFERHSTTPATNICEYKELMTKLHDRVGVLASLDEDQRNRLEAIDKKIIQFEENNLARLDSLGVQQMDANKRLDVIEHLQRMNNRQVEELKGDLLLLQQQNQKQLENEIRATRVARQVNTTGDFNSYTPSSSNDMRMDCQTKLDALSVLLASTRLAINVLQTEVAANLTRVLQSTSTTQRRLANLVRRQQTQSNLQNFLPQPANLFGGVSNIERSFETECIIPHANDALGIKKIQLSANLSPFYVACDDEFQGGHWTVIQHRYSGEINFQRDWIDYKTGFGNLGGEFFIGLDKLHALTTSSLHELMILMLDHEGAQRFARYSTFAIGSEKELYALNLLGSHSGDAGDALSYSAGSKFSTFDNDNDGWVEGNCALAHTGAWWFNACERSNLNGQYLKGGYNAAQTFQGMYWHDFHGPTYALKSVRMMIRPLNYDQDQRR